MENGVPEFFRAWLSGPARQYRLSDAALYSPSEMATASRDCVNPYLMSEDDVKVKFGGYLEQRLLELSSNLTVHTELHIYGVPQARADLSLHDISAGTLWLSSSLITTTLRAAIEIKYATFRKPDYEFKNGRIPDDLKRLASLPSGVLKFLLIIDEGSRVSTENMENTKRFANDARITILSNNPAFNS